VIRLVALEIFIAMLRVTTGLTALAAVVTVMLCLVARKRWSASRPALGAYRVALGSVVWGLLWTLLWLLSVPGKWAALGLLPLLISAFGLFYIAFGHHKRGYERPALVVPSSWALLLGVAALFLAIFGVHTYNAALARQAAARVAEGQRDQHYFHALARVDDGTVAVVGTTSTRPYDADDVWLHTFDVEGNLLRSATYQRPGNQTGLALSPLPGGSFLLGGRDEDHPFLARANRGPIHGYRRWDVEGAVAVLHPIAKGRFLLGGRSADQAWVALVDPTGHESWRREVETQIDYPQINALVVTGDRFVAAGSDYLFARGAFLAGGTLAGSVDWIKAYASERNARVELTHLRAKDDGTLVALGSRGVTDKLEDLWLVHLSPDGTILGELTLGNGAGELPGGLALRGEEIVIAGHRFSGLEARLWLRVVDLRGRIVWEKNYADSQFGRARDIALVAGGDILAVGNRTRASKSDAWIARFDRVGNIVWQRTYP
jgi:hypothetical protein